MSNCTQVSYFALVAYFDTGLFRDLCFLVVMLLYVVTVGVNLLLIVLICLSSHLREPLYMFLCGLFVNEVCGSSSVFPPLLLQLLSDSHTVSRFFCFLQIYCVHFYGSVEFFTLGVMSYDRYLAICRPLQYGALMTSGRVVILTVFIWLYSVLATVVMMSLSVPLRLCGNVINKVYCDNYSIVKLSCSDTTVNNVYGITYMFTVIFCLILLIVYTYVRILRVCFRGSAQTRQKAVSTCTPHLASLLNFSFGCFFEIVQSRFDMRHIPNALRVFLSLYWLVCQPLFNPLMYGLNMSKIRIVFRSAALRK